MLLDRDESVNKMVVTSLLKEECQFIITYINPGEETVRVRVAFHEGTWKIMRDNGDYFEFYDSFNIVECNNNLLRGLVVAKTESVDSEHWENRDWWRAKPAKVIIQVLELWIGKFENIISIDVTQFGRDGWFVNFTDK